MDDTTRDLIEACRLATEPTGIETPTYRWFMSHEDEWMALDQAMTINGLNQEIIKFCFWAEDCRLQLNKKFGRLDFIEYDIEASMGRDPEGYMSGLLRRAAHHAQFWQEQEQRKVADAVRLAHATTKDAIRMRARRRAGKVKSRPPRPARTLEQNVEARRKAVETRIAKIAAFEKNNNLHNMYMRDYLSASFKTEKSLRSARKALATAERLLAESLAKA
jgi:hypothetical protein